MTKFGILGVTALLAAALAGPASAQDVTFISGPHVQIARDNAYRNDGAWRDSYNRWDDRNVGITPGDIAAGVVGGVAGTAAVIATAPIGGEAYARQNGFVCLPGTWFRGEDGRMHICQ